MTKFGKAEKIGQYGFIFQNIRFSHFQSRNREGAKCEDLWISMHLRHGKRVEASKSQDRRNISLLKSKNWTV
jgi:hypothetical protein